MSYPQKVPSNEVEKDGAFFSRKEKKSAFLMFSWGKFSSFFQNRVDPPQSMYYLPLRFLLKDGSFRGRKRCLIRNQGHIYDAVGGLQPPGTKEKSRHGEWYEGLQCPFEWQSASVCGLWKFHK